MNLLKWFTSRTYREATDLRKQVWVLINSQRDILTPQAVDNLEAGLKEFEGLLKSPPPSEQLTAACRKLEETATKWLKPYPNASWRENIKEFEVSAVLVLSIFCFFAQPMKIPSGSAQPTLYGNLATDLRGATNVTIPDWPGRLREWFCGVDYYVWQAKSDGALSTELTTSAGFIKILKCRVGDDYYSIWFPSDQMQQMVDSMRSRPFRKGDTVLRVRASSGDRLFIDRFTYNFRRPERGETIVFTTEKFNEHLHLAPGSPGVIADTHYIKRLIALGGEHVSIGDDRHVRINGKRLDGTVPHFENVYAFSGPPQDSVYSGHVNGTVAAQNRRPGLAGLFPDEKTELVVRPNHYLAFGDNTMNSHDGRNWGDFPREKVVGKALFVFWPLTSRFGPVNR